MSLYYKNILNSIFNFFSHITIYSFRWTHALPVNIFEIDNNFIILRFVLPEKKNNTIILLNVNKVKYFTKVIFLIITQILISDTKITNIYNFLKCEYTNGTNSQNQKHTNKIGSSIKVCQITNITLAILWINMVLK